MLTPFGKICRKIRIDSGEIMKYMAEKLNVTPAYLSAVEVGKRNVPKDWPEKICGLYSLTTEQCDELKKAASESMLQLKLNLNKYDNGDKDLAMAFARQFTELSDADKDTIRGILMKKDK